MKFERWFCNDPCSPRGGFLKGKERKGKERKGKGWFVFQASFPVGWNPRLSLNFGGICKCFQNAKKKWNRE